MKIVVKASAEAVSIVAAWQRDVIDVVYRWHAQKRLKMSRGKTSSRALAALGTRSAAHSARLRISPHLARTHCTHASASIFGHQA